MDLNRELIARLRAMASKGATVKMMVDAIRDHVKTDDGLALAADAYFWKAFLLPLGEVRDIEGSFCLGGKVYSDEQIDLLMIPRIERTRQLWDSSIATKLD